jgi:chromosome partitioning protein
VLVDCAPGGSLLADCWLQAADYHITPVRPDMQGLKSMEQLQRAAGRVTSRFGGLLGVIVNMKNARCDSDSLIERHMREAAGAASTGCFAAAIPAVAHIERSALHNGEMRSFQNKYPGDAGAAIRAVTSELLARVAASAASRNAADDMAIWREAAE